MGCCREDELRTFAAKIEAAYAEYTGPNVVEICKSILVANQGQNHSGEVAARVLSYIADFSDHKDFCFTFSQMGLDNVFYVLDPASPRSTTWIRASSTRPSNFPSPRASAPSPMPGAPPRPGAPSPGVGRTLSDDAGRTLSVYPRA